MKINWKRFARELWHESMSWEKAWEESRDEVWEVAYAIAEKAGTPKFSETGVSCMDMLRMGLDRLEVKKPDWIGELRDDENEATVRFEQLRALVKKGQRIHYHRHMWMPNWKVALIERLLK